MFQVDEKILPELHDSRVKDIKPRIKQKSYDELIQAKSYCK